jgi:hypothetical protein
MNLKERIQLELSGQTQKDDTELLREALEYITNIDSDIQYLYKLINILDEYDLPTRPDLLDKALAQLKQDYDDLAEMYDTLSDTQAIGVC